MTAIRELIEAVEAGDWPAGMDGAARQVFPYNERASDDLGNRAVEAFDGSLDAALALMAAVLPNEGGWWWSIGHHDKDAPRYNADVWRTGPSCPFYRQNPAMADTPARALLLAILKAMEARG